MNLNPNRPLERLVGQNRGICRQIINRDVHAGMSDVSAVRHVLRSMKHWRDVPVGLKRGLILECVETQRENRDLFRYVMS